ncbi:hypothetical protein T439DRAFT_324340 [Meredithblackwellia eburnea MCA 4105]
MVDYRGAVVEDLQLSPALVLPSDTPAGTALRLAFERDFSILPISNPITRSLEGWVDVNVLKQAIEQSKVEDEAPLKSVLVGVKNFPKKSQGYQVITPDTPLEDLDTFLHKDDTISFALVTDAGRKFVLGLCTREDLQKFNSRRNPNGAKQ